MKKVILFLIISINIGIINGQTQKASVIINSNKDIIETQSSKLITFYTKGLSKVKLDGLTNGLKHVQGAKLHFLNVTDKKLEVANGKIELENTYNKNQLIDLLNKYDVDKIVFNGEPKTLKEFFYRKEKGELITN